jgi:hypothetical protein
MSIILHLYLFGNFKFNSVKHPSDAECRSLAEENNFSSHSQSVDLWCESNIMAKHYDAFRSLSNWN